MAEDFKVNRIDVDKDGLAEDMKAQMPDFYREEEVELPKVEKPKYEDPDYKIGTDESIGAKGYDSDFSRNAGPGSSYYEHTHRKEGVKGSSQEESEEKEQETKPEPAAGGEPVPRDRRPVTETPHGEAPEAGTKPSFSAGEGMPEKEGAGEMAPQGIEQTGDEGLGGGQKGLDKGKGKGKNSDVPEEEKTAAEKKKEEKERADENNANNIRNAAEVAIASKNPYAMAVGGAIKAADKATGGKSTELLGKAMTKANKVAPGGRRIQRASNKLNESGASDAVGTAASAKSGGGGANAADKADKAQKAKQASDNAEKAKNTGDKAKKGKEVGEQKSKGTTGGGDTTGGSTAFGDFIKDGIKHFFMRHPFALAVLILLGILFLILLANGDFKGGSGGGKYCSYELTGVTSTGSVKLDSVQVELINCDGNASNYKVLETIDFEKYVVGVALAEVSWRKDAPEYFKAAIVAARGFSLKRNSGMCPSNPDNCFYGYNAETGKIRMRACTNDQVYCDIDKPCYHVTRSGKPTIYGPEAEGMSGATVWKGQLDETTKAEILAAAEEVRGKVLVDDSGNVVNTNYVNTDQQHWYELAKQGKNYEQILVEHYSSQNAKGMNSAKCTSYGNIDYGNYELSSEGDTILNERLDKFLEKKGTSLEAFNNLIKSNVEKNGYGTRAGVVTAAVTLIAELGNKYDTKVPYFLSGGHHDGVKIGALGYWGSGYEDDGRRCIYSGYGNVYTVCGLDCSGFVPWAIKNGGFQMGVRLAGDFHTLDGARKVSLNSGSAVLEAGDLLESSGHIVLVVGVDENSKQYICAEASGKNSGVLFTRRSFADSGYWGVKMDGYYDKYSLKGK